MWQNHVPIIRDVGRPETDGESYLDFAKSEGSESDLHVFEAWLVSDIELQDCSQNRIHEIIDACSTVETNFISCFLS